jgi:hypothetical protein
MLLRLMSETGIYGMGVMILLLIRCWISKPNAIDNETWVMSNGLTIIILVYLIRQGHYFLNGFPLFLWLYYYLSVQNKHAMAHKRAEIKAAEIAQFRPSTSTGQLFPGHT